MSDYSLIARTLMESLKLRVAPVAVCLTDKPPQGVSGPSKPAADCTDYTDDTKIFQNGSLRHFDDDPMVARSSQFPVPQVETDVRRIEVDKSNPNRIWWSSAGGTTAGTTGGEFNGGARMGFIEILY